MSEQVRLAMHADPLAAAAISPCGLYRYHLIRGWEFGRGVGCVVMLNPSTADATTDDPTVRKCIGFLKRRGLGALSVVNLYAYRATKPAELCRAARAGLDIVGPHTDAFIRRAFRRSQEIVFAWGALSAQRPPEIRSRVERVIELAHEAHRVPLCLARSESGDPRHPLMLGYDAALWSEWP